MHIIMQTGGISTNVNVTFFICYQKLYQAYSIQIRKLDMNGEIFFCDILYLCRVEREKLVKLLELVTTDYFSNLDEQLTLTSLSTILLSVVYGALTRDLGLIITSQPYLETRFDIHYKFY